MGAQSRWSRAFHAIGRISGVFLLVLGCGTFLAACGLLRGDRWAWWFAVVLFATDVTGNLVSYLFLHDAVRTISGAIISTGFLYLLCRGEVRAYLNIRS
ncbi:MAG TPA: hypothetical protein VFB76_09425 [Candidatus Angelobacter sp.]|nr:hypothetical protein [Candidatus Angelobacter sp.]